MSSGDKFVSGKIRHNSTFGAGPSDAGNFDTPNPRFLVDNRVCETLAGPNFEQYGSSVFAQRVHSANYYVVDPGNTPENHPHLQKDA